MPETTTLAVAVCSPTLAVIVAWPSWTGTTRPSTTVATLGSLEDHDDLLGHLASGLVALELLHDQVLPALRRAQLALRGQQHEPLGGRARAPAPVRPEAWKGRQHAGS